MQIRADRAHVEDEDLMLFPWDAVDTVTAGEYLRKSRFFLEFAGFVDPKLMHHKRGINRMVVPREREEIVRGMTEFLERSLGDPRSARNAVIRFIEGEKRRIEAGLISPNTLRNSLKPIRLALELNEVPISWKKIMRLVPRARRKGKDREYALEEIRRLVNVASLHLKVAMLFMASSGIRVGAFDYLNVGHIRPLEKDGELLCGLMTVYADEGDDEYETLISKEAYLVFQEYLQARRNSGETVTEDSPAIVTRDGKRRCRSGTIRNSITKLLWKTGIRSEKKKRYDVQVDHGFRKFFDNVAKDYVDEDYVEKLIGHDTGTKEHYDRHIPKPAVEQYLKAMPYLSIDQVYRVEAELSSQLEEKQTEIDVRYNELRLESIEKDARIKRLQEELAEYRGFIEKARPWIEKKMLIDGDG